MSGFLAKRVSTPAFASIRPNKQRRQRGLGQVEAAERVLAPVRLEAFGRDLKERGGAVAAGVVHAAGQWRESLRFGNEAARVLGLRGVADDGRHPGARSFQLGHGRLELLGVAPGHRHWMAGGGEAPGDSRAQALARADADDENAAFRAAHGASYHIGASAGTRPTLA